MSRDPSPLREVLQAAGARLGLEGALETGLLWTRWRDIVGDQVAMHAEPTSLKGGVLRVRTDSPTWATEIGYLADDIKERANRVVGRALVSDVRIWTSPEPIRARHPERVRAPRTPSAKALEMSADGDPETILERAREAWRKRRSGAPS